MFLSFEACDMFNDTSRYLDDIFTIDNPEFEKYIPDIYWTKKERYHFGDVTFLSSRWKWIYGIWNIVNNRIPHRVMS